jgi:dTDP-4-dehydrorhamnose reductase
MKYLIIGDKGQLGSKFRDKFTTCGFDFLGVGSEICDITDIDSVYKTVSNFNPDIILNCAAYNLVDDAEKDNTLAFRVNQKGAKNLAEVASSKKSFLVHFSSDYVFDGDKGDLYIESDSTNPINEYGKSKLSGEKSLAEVCENYLIFRLSWVYGNGKQNFIYKFSEWASKNKVLNITEDEYSIPTSVNLISNVTMKALESGLNGLFHLTAGGIASRLDWANEIKNLKNMDVEINPVPISSFNLPAKRPFNSAMYNSLLSSLIGNIPDWKDDLKNFLI